MRLCSHINLRMIKLLSHNMTSCDQAVVKVVLWSRGARLTKPGWSKPHTHSNPTNMALFRHKITLYRFNKGGGLILLQGSQMGAGGLSPPTPLTLTTAIKWTHSTEIALSIRLLVTSRRFLVTFAHNKTLPSCLLTLHLYLDWQNCVIQKDLLISIHFHPSHIKHCLLPS